MSKTNRYEQIISTLFHKHFAKNQWSFEFNRSEFEEVARQLGISLPKNLGDIIYSFRYRAQLPADVIATAPEGKTWIIRPAGRGKYRFVCCVVPSLIPRHGLAETKVPNATPGLIEMYALSDEQALLAKVRYNRLIDIFTGLACYSLQNHLRTTTSEIGQLEVDELYIGIDKRGAHYVLPVQAKGGRDKLSVVQVEQDLALCREKFPSLGCRAIGAQFMDDSLIALFELEEYRNNIQISREMHYRLVPPEDISPEDLQLYQRRTGEGKS